MGSIVLAVALVALSVATGVAALLVLLFDASSGR
jgi:hypothetical protein